MKRFILTGIICCGVALLQAETGELLAPPQPLRDAEGRAEIGLIDPFSRPADRAPAADAGEGMMRTSLGEISSDFKILGIVIPDDPARQPSAVLRMTGEADPMIVYPGDIVRVENARLNQTGRRNVARFRRGERDPLDEQLKDFVFYLHIKAIHPTSLEVFHNKKRPDETIILNW